MLGLNELLKIMLLTFSFLGSVNCKCDSFESVTMHVIPKTGDPFNTTVEGCIERLTFDEGRILVREVYVNKQPIQHLKRDAVKHLVNLRVLSFTECSSETIEAGAFRNVPVLAVITLAFGHLKTIPIDVFNNLQELEKLQLNNNEINSIDDEAFAALSTLKTLNVSHNHLQVLNKNWFLNDVALTRVDFSYNKIQKIPKGAFHNLTNLTEIYLNDNALTEIQSRAFQGVRRLSVLSLSNNFLTILNANIFHTNNVRIQKFYIDANRLNFIGSDALSKIKVNQITLEGNPWKCPCLDRINFWVYQNNGTVENLDRCRNVNIPNCIYALTFSETCLDVIDEEATRTFFDRIQNTGSDLETFKLNKCVRFDD